MIALPGDAAPRSHTRPRGARASFGAVCGVPEEDIQFFEHDAAEVIKIPIPRPYSPCDLEDGDALGGQQHAPLVELKVPD